MERARRARQEKCEKKDIHLIEDTILYHVVSIVLAY